MSDQPEVVEQVAETVEEETTPAEEVEGGMIVPHRATVAYALLLTSDALLYTCICVHIDRVYDLHLQAHK